MLRKPVISYYASVLITMILLNALHQIRFMLQETNDKETIYSLVPMNNSSLFERLMKASSSSETASRIDNEVLSFIKDAHGKATKILKENRELLDNLSKYLLDKVTITGEEFKKITDNESKI